MILEYSPTYSILKGCPSEIVEGLSLLLEHGMSQEQLLPFINSVGKLFPFTKSYAFKATLDEDTGKYNVKFYSGFLRTVLNFLNNRAIHPTITTSRSKYTCSDKEISDLLYPHQKRIVANCISKKRGIVKSPTSSGKSITIAELIRKFNNDGLKVLVTVPTISLLDQMTNDIHSFRKLHGCEPIEIGRVGDGSYDFKDVTVGIPNSLSKVEKTGDYLATVDALLSDECLTKDSLVLTTDGYISIADKSIVGKQVLSFHPLNGYELKEIYAHFVQGLKPILKISCHKNELRCTSNHKIKTIEGWKLASQITTEDYIQSIVPNATIMILEHLDYIKEDKDIDVKTVITDLSIPTLNLNGQILNCHRKLKVLFMEHCLEIVVYTILTQMQSLLDLNLLTEKYKKNGRIIKHQSLLIWILNVKQLLIKVMEIFPELEQVIPIQTWLIYITVLQKIIKNKLVSCGWIIYLMKELLGGIWMMEHYLIQEYLPTLDFLQKDIHYQKWSVSQLGYLIKDLLIQLNNQNKDIGLLNLALKYLETGLITLEDTVPIVCSISFEKVVNIHDDGYEEVYDISVKDNHNFITNNLLVHNCHTTANATYAVVIEHLTNRAISIGFSATPWTADGSNILLEAFYGNQIVEISESEMIAKDIIMEPLFEFYPAPAAFIPNSIAKHASNISSLTDAHRYKTLASVYNYVIIDNKARNNMIVNKAIERINLGCGPVLIIVNKVKGQHNHADVLTELFESKGVSLPTISGYISKKKKESLINDLKECKIPGAIAGPKVLSAGISIHSLSTIILAGAGRSDSEFIQRVGRLLRKKEGKERPLVIDFQDPQYWFASQSRSRIETAESIYGSSNIILR